MPLIKTTVQSDKAVGVKERSSTGSLPTHTHTLEGALEDSGGKSKGWVLVGQETQARHFKVIQHSNPTVSVLI